MPFDLNRMLRDVARTALGNHMTRREATKFGTLAKKTRERLIAHLLKCKKCNVRFVELQAPACSSLRGMGRISVFARRAWIAVLAMLGCRPAVKPHDGSQKVIPITRRRK